MQLALLASENTRGNQLQEGALKMVRARVCTNIYQTLPSGTFVFEPLFDVGPARFLNEGCSSLLDDGSDVEAGDSSISQHIEINEACAHV
jgi:hypothetical protein